MIDIYEYHEILNKRIYLGRFESVEDFCRQMYTEELYNEDRENNHTCAVTYEEAITNRVIDINSSTAILQAIEKSYNELKEFTLSQSNNQI